MRFTRRKGCETLLDILRSVTLAQKHTSDALSGRFPCASNGRPMFPFFESAVRKAIRGVLGATFQRRRRCPGKRTVVPCTQWCRTLCTGVAKRRKRIGFVRLASIICRKLFVRAYVWGRHKAKCPQRLRGVRWSDDRAIHAA